MSSDSYDPRPRTENRAASSQRPLALVLGASGYVGGRLVPRLLDNGYAVRCLARSPGKLAGRPWTADVEVVEGDLSTDDLSAAFAGTDVVVHLARSMGAAESSADADRTIAHRVAVAAEQAGVRRVVYLGCLGEVEESTSAHPRRRADVGEILLPSAVPATVLRAAVIIGAGSAAFEMLGNLTERLPAMVTPRWVRSRVQPIAIGDVLRYLVGVVDDPSDDDYVFDITGPDVLTYQDMLRQYAAAAGLPRRPIVNVPLVTPALSAFWVSLVTPLPYALARPLVLSLAADVIKRADGEDIATLVPGECLPSEEAVRLALGRVRERDVETSWRDAEIGGRTPAAPYPGDQRWSGGTLLHDVRTAQTWAGPEFVSAAVTRVGGDRGWPSLNLLWQVRGLLDRIAGGVGLRRGRRDPDTLRIGDALDFWRVEDLRPPSQDSDWGLLRLRAEMWVPGRAWLEWRVDATATGSRLTQRALFAPRGLLGRLYWLAMAPFHAPIFTSMVTALARQAETLARAGDGLTAATSSGAPTAPPGGRVEGDAPPDPGPRRARRAG